MRYVQKTVKNARFLEKYIFCGQFSKILKNFNGFHFPGQFTKKMIYDMIKSRKKIFWSCVGLFYTLGVIIS